MTREELKHITDLCFTTPMAIRRSGEKKTYHEEEIAEAKRTVMELLEKEPKTGHWIWCVGSHKCSNCEEYTCFSHKELLRYCPNCGARMSEVSE